MSRSVPVFDSASERFGALDTGVILLAAPVAAFLVSTLLARRLARQPQLLPTMLDTPNERSLHEGSVPRTGGIAICAALAAGYLAVATAFPPPAARLWMGAAVLLVGIVSFLDDLGHVKARYRLTAHIVAAALLLIGGVSWSELDLPGLHWVIPSPVAELLTLAYLVWMVNLYNFMDGMDGFASGMAVFGFSALALLGWRAGDPGFALTNALVAAAAAGFLMHNFPPARIFLGDLGSATLGLLAAILSLTGSQRGLFPLWAAWLAFSPFIVDATWTLLRRLAAGERIWQPHRRHHYQRLVLAGWSHRKTVLRSYLVMGACSACAVAAPNLSGRDQQLLLAAWAIIYVVIGLRIQLAERQGNVTAS